MSKVTVIDHPLVQHKLALLRGSPAPAPHRQDQRLRIEKLKEI